MIIKISPNICGNEKVSILLEKDAEMNYKSDSNNGNGVVRNLLNTYFTENIAN